MEDVIGLRKGREGRRGRGRAGKRLQEARVRGDVGGRAGHPDADAGASRRLS